jgi:hypothetical protein
MDELAVHAFDIRAVGSSMLGWKWTRRIGGHCRARDGRGPLLYFFGPNKLFNKFPTGF